MKADDIRGATRGQSRWYDRLTGSLEDSRRSRRIVEEKRSLILYRRQDEETYRKVQSTRVEIKKRCRYVDHLVIIDIIRRNMERYENTLVLETLWWKIFMKKDQIDIISHQQIAYAQFSRVKREGWIRISRKESVNDNDHTVKKCDQNLNHIVGSSGNSTGRGHDLHLQLIDDSRIVIRRMTRWVTLRREVSKVTLIHQSFFLQKTCFFESYFGKKKKIQY